MADTWQSLDDHAAPPAPEVWQSLDDVSPRDPGTRWKTAAPPAQLPNLPKPPLPYELQSDAEQLANAPTWTNPRTGVTYHRQAPGQENNPLSKVLDSPITGSQEMGAGVEQMTRPTLREKAGGLHRVIGGAFEAATPLMVGTGLAAPVKTALSVGAGVVSQEAISGGLHLLGMPQEYANLLGDLGGAVAAVKAVPAAERYLVYRTLRNIVQEHVNSEFKARQAAEQEAAKPKQLGAAPEPTPPAPDPDIPYGDAPPDEALPAGQTQPQLGPDTRPQRLLGGATPGYPRPAIRMPGETIPGEPIPAGPANGEWPSSAWQALSPLDRVDQGISKIGDLSPTDLVDFLKAAHERIQGQPQPAPVQAEAQAAPAGPDIFDQVAATPTAGSAWQDVAEHSAAPDAPRPPGSPAPPEAPPASPNAQISQPASAAAGESGESGLYGPPAPPAQLEWAPNDQDRLNNVLHPQMPTLVDALRDRLAKGQSTNGTELTALGKTHLGGSVADGTVEMKDLYDASETAMNQYIADTVSRVTAGQSPEQIIPQLEKLTSLMPTQTVRNTEQNEFQQYSTPPALSYLAAKAADIQPGETVLEPSAGTGSLATFARAMGGQVATNELAPRRRGFLELQKFTPTGHNAEHIANMMPAFKADVVLMNPPFSASAGRLKSNKNIIGFQHVLSALDALKPGGRLVAILGDGARLDLPGAAPLWKGIAKRGARVLANIGMNGENYRKYGTTFDNRLIVIDKTPPIPGQGGIAITGDYRTIEEGYHAIADAVSRGEASRGPSREPVPAPPPDLRPVSGRPPGPAQSGTGVSGVRGGQPGSGNGGVRPTQRPGPERSTAPPPGGTGLRPPAPGPVPAAPSSPGTHQPDLGGVAPASGGPLSIETGSKPSHFGDGTYQTYQPAKLRSGVSHEKATGTGLVETSSMAAVEPPDITYQPKLPASVIASGHITDAQLESIVYAGQAHSGKLPSGIRAGYMNGDGTGVGKGTIAAGIALDNWNQGRKKILWLSLKSGLVKQAQRDLDWVNSGIQARMANEWGFDEPIQHEGVVFSSYAMLTQKGGNAALPSRLDRILEWEPDVVLLDESHSLKNAVGSEIYEDPAEEGKKKNIFSSEGTKSGAAALEMDRKLPNARMAYFSATAFTDVRNLGYASRLGLWGQGTDFPTFRDFLVEIERGGLGAMELVARELKTLGRYTARQISFNGVESREVPANLSGPQRQMYDSATRAWQSILANIDKAIDLTVDESAKGSSRGIARMNALKNFWSGNQRFYRQLLTTMKVPAVIGEIEKALAENKSVFLDLVSTGEAESQRQFSGALQSGVDYGDLDLSAKQIIKGYLDKCFPIYQMEDYEDENGATQSRHVVDDKGNNVVNQEALALQNELKKGLDQIQLPKAPLDEIIDAFGPDQVAEISGRKSRIIEDPNSGKPIEVKRSKPKGSTAKDVNEWERQNFMSGKKRIAIASGAGGTGFDFHSDKRVANQQRRVHITMEPSWSADAQMQKYGRTHRTNQVIPPEYVLVATDLGGEKRFISAIASRLASLGALTRGERQVGGAGEVLAKYNLEGEYGQAAVDAVLGQIENNQGAINTSDVTIPLKPLPAELVEIGQKQVQALLGLRPGTNTAPVGQFLNRVLNLPTGIQKALFDHYMNTFEDIVRRVKEAGTFDEGTTQLKAVSASIKSSEVVKQNPGGAPTRHVVVDAEFPVSTVPWKDAQAHITALRDSPGAIVTNKKSGMLWALRRSSADVLDQTTGQMVPMATMLNVRGHRRTMPWAQVTAESFERAPNAQGAWEKALAAVPKTEHEDVHLITGSVLGVWKTLSANADGWKVPVVSVRGQGGEPITGIRLPNSTAADTVAMLSGKGDFSPAATFGRVWDRGIAQPLSGGLRLQKSRMMGEQSLTITGGGAQAQGQLARIPGLKSNQTAAGTRFYIPISASPSDVQRAQAITTLGEVLRLFPPATERRSGERGSLDVTELGKALYRLLHDQDENGVRANYSGMGAVADRFLRNLSQLEQASPNAHAAAIRAASSRAQSATILRAAVPAILQKLKGSDYTWPEMRLALIESRLRGIRARWTAFADSLSGMSNLDLYNDFTGAGDFLSLLDSIEGKRGLPQDLSQTAVSFIQSGDTFLHPTQSHLDPKQVAGYYQDLRDFLAQAFDDAAKNVTTAMDPDWYDAVVKDPQVKQALDVYKQLVEGPMADNHRLNEGVFSNALGPLGIYYPLIPVEGAAVPGPGRRLPYHRPRNTANAFATGLSDQYDATTDALRDRIAGAVRANDKAALIQVLQSEGLIQEAFPGVETFTRNGQVYDAERVEMNPARQIIKDGKSTFIPARMGVMPKWLARELAPILERPQLSAPTVLDKILRAVNTFALAGPADFVFHSANLFGTLIANTPYLENSTKGKLLSAPLLKKFTALSKVLSTDPTTVESAADLIEMAKVGALPDRYGSVTFSKQAAEELGAEQKRFSFSPLLFGPKGIDVRARLVMWRLAKSINPGATPQQLHHFVNQLGNYVPALQSEIERALKRSGFSPFFTAGSTMLRNGVNAWTGRGPMPKDGLDLRMWQQLTGGGIALLMLWALTHELMTGKFPWQDKRAKLLQIPAPDGLRRSAFGKQLWGNGPEVGYVNFGFFNPLALRGARALGMPGAFETGRLGGTAGQRMEAAQRDTLNAFAHPALGPAARALFVGATGEEPYLTSLRDRSGHVGLSFFPAIDPKTKPGLPAIGARMAAAGKEMNAFYGSLGEATGMLGHDKGMKGNHYLRMMIDLAAPGLVSNASNPYKRSATIRAQQH